MENLAVDQVIMALDVIGVVAFAISGALEASRRQMDLVGFILIATVTGLGGGTMRDVLLGVTPVAWVIDPMMLSICITVAVAVFFTAHIVESRFTMLVWCDALGLATCCVLGAERATAHGASGVAAVLLGVMSATFGGLVRDVMCNEVPLILRKEIYATAAAAGAGVYVLCHAWGLERTVMISVAFLVAFCIRALALRYQLSLPTYRSRAGRDI